MDIVRATEKYEQWLAKTIPLVSADLEHKHALMAEGDFPFFRASFYRWAQIWPEVAPKSASAPEVLGVGDLHVENFGTWRDIEGRLIWGINDFDEACHIPYTCDLVRLTASAHMAVGSCGLKISAARASEEILAGYLDGMERGGQPFALAEHHPALRRMAVERLKEPERFYEKLESLETLKEKIPSPALKGLRRMLPERGLDVRIVHRVSGLGSLGRRRYVALAFWRGGTIAREAKELAPSAWLWAKPGSKLGESRNRPVALRYQEILDCARRAPDPFVKMRGGWIVRRLAPDCSRIELSSLPEEHDAVRLLHAMGFETANVHLGSVKSRVILSDLRKRPERWLHHAAVAMVESTHQDRLAWTRHMESMRAAETKKPAKKTAKKR